MRASQSKAGVPVHLTWAMAHYPGDYFHIARRDMRGRRPCRLHTHGFAEVFWIESGVGDHLINGQRVNLQRGDLVTIRPRDCHNFRPIDAQGFVLNNVAFPLGTLDFLRRRYFPDETRFFWAIEEVPFQTALKPSQFCWIHECAARLFKAAKTKVEIERFLLNLLHELFEQDSTDQKKTVPWWLRKALGKIHLPEHFSRGTRELSRLAERCPEHVTRELKKCFHATATDVVNHARMEHAALQLKMTSQEIIQIALDCGFQNLSHFYKVFRKQFGTTPRAFRLRQQATVR